MKRLLTAVFLWVAGTMAGAAEYNIGTGGVSGTYYPSIKSLCELVNQKNSAGDCTAAPSDGSIANMQGVLDGSLQFGVVQSDVLHQAYTGTETFSGQAKAELRGVMALYSELLALVVSKKSKIQVLEDIKGKRINIGHPGSGTETTARLLLQEAGIAPEDLASAGELKAEDCPAALKAGKIDGYFYMVGHPAENIRQAAVDGSVSLIMLDGPPIYAMLEKYPYYIKEAIPGGIYQGAKDEIPSVGVKAALVTRADAPDAVVEQVLGTVLEHFKSLRERHPAPVIVNKQELSQNLIVPLHDAARRLYKKAGLPVPEQAK